MPCPKIILLAIDNPFRIFLNIVGMLIPKSILLNIVGLFHFGFS